MSRLKSASVFILRCVAFVLFMGVLVWLFIFSSSSGADVEQLDIVFVPTQDDADCTLLFSRNKTVMIDTGEENDFEAIAEILEEYDVSRIDCLILTHPDKDHIGSAAAVLENYEVGMVVEPYYALQNERNDIVQDIIEAKNISCLKPARERKLVFGDMHLSIYPPEEFSYDNDNNYSLAVLVSHGDTTMFFAGDAVRKRTEELMRIPLENVTLYKMSYHGRNYNGAEELLEKLNPQIVVITASEIETEVEEMLEGREVYFTVGTGVHLISDGTNIFF